MKFCSINGSYKSSLFLKGPDYSLDQENCQVKGQLLVPLVCTKLTLAFLAGTVVSISSIRVNYVKQSALTSAPVFPCC